MGNLERFFKGYPLIPAALLMRINAILHFIIKNLSRG
jgi:hypothetical protein